jgi:hypothetical protein
MAPQMFAVSRQSIAKSGIFFDVPTGLANRQFGWVKHLGHNRHQAKDPEEARRGAFDGAVRPLPLGLP